ncbi:unnamed protein product [Closterium sp. Yama58-4]|nr:unnamed protein product [Closterium sp. Yama58-4]
MVNVSFLISWIPLVLSLLFFLTCACCAVQGQRGEEDGADVFLKICWELVKASGPRAWSPFHSGVILETEPTVIANRVAMRGADADLPLSEQTISQALATAKYHLARSLLK